MKHYLYVLLIGLIIGAVLGYKFKQPNVEVVTNTEYVYDTIVQTIKEPYEVVITEIVEIPVPYKVIDTVYILQEYFTQNVYNRKWEDNELKIELTDTVFNNKLFTGQLTYSILRPTEIHTTTVQHYTKYATLEGILPLSEGFDFGIRGSYVGNNIYSLTYRPQSNTFELGFGFKIKQW